MQMYCSKGAAAQGYCKQCSVPQSPQQGLANHSWTIHQHIQPWMLAAQMLSCGLTILASPL